jgi:hypothetical protein
MFNKFIIAIREYKDYCNSYIRQKRYFKYMPEKPLHDDLYLLAYPKSGITWLSFLLANVNVKMSGSNQQVTLYNINDIVPDIEHDRFLKDNILSFPGHRIIKSHSEYNPFYKKMIYLVRDPRDVMVSYYYFLKKLGLFNHDLTKLVHSQIYGIEAWCRHVQGWVEKTTASDSIDFVRYEDIKSAPLGVLTRIYTLLGHQIPQEILEQSIELSSFENMKKLEAYCNYGGDFRFPGFEFVRKGEAGGYRTEISKEDLELINEKASRWLSVFGYSGE